MKIDEGKLQDILSRRKVHIKSYGTLIEALLAFLSYIVSILLSGILNAGLKIQIAVAIITLAYFVVFFLSIRGSKYSVQELYNDIVSAADIHSFSLIVVKNSQGKYLLQKNKRWHTFLLPFQHTKDTNDREAVLKFSKIIGFESPKIIKTLETDITKHSVSANMSKTYHHTFYEIDFERCSFSEKPSFKINGERFHWYSIEEMKRNKDMLLKNKETIEFIEKNF